MSNQEGTEYELVEVEKVDSNDTVPDASVDNEVTSTAQVVEPEAQASDMSYNVASVFVISMIVGLLVFHIFSRRWQT